MRPRSCGGIVCTGLVRFDHLFTRNALFKCGAALTGGAPKQHIDANGETGVLRQTSAHRLGAK